MSSEKTRDVLLDYFRDLGEEGQEAVELAISTWLHEHPQGAWNTLWRLRWVGPWETQYAPGGAVIRMYLSHLGTGRDIAFITRMQGAPGLPQNSVPTDPDGYVWHWFLADDLTGTDLGEDRGPCQTLADARRSVEEALPSRGWKLLPGEPLDYYRRAGLV